MENAKRILVPLVLLLVIAGAVILVVKKYTGAPTQPDRVLDREITKVDTVSGKLVTLKYREWQGLGAKDGKYKNPETQQFTMVDPIICAACHAKIPPVELPPEPGVIIPPEGASEKEIEALAEKENAAREAYEVQVIKLMNDYLCPKCGKHAYPYQEVTGR